MSQREHKSLAPSQVRCFILTVSDTRSDRTDTSGRAIAELLVEAGHIVAKRALVRDDAEEVSAIVREQIASDAVDVIVTTGGTGISSRDGTFEAIDALLDKRLDGFGELFRMLSYHDIGPAAMLSRACAGVAHGTVVVALPGAEAAVRLALTKLLVPELPHLVQQAKK
ncbi:MAG: molybdenum cofactor biosynthesis protein MoaB [Acidobacteria bacterium]|nr:molybdenum cofactor biosynthesis protein MoaB [Acidobacteriota bacterium]